VLFRSPARLVFSREEELTVAPARPAQRVRVRVGVCERQLVALELDVLADVGAYAAESALLLRAAAREALSLYHIPHLRFLGQAAFTDRPPTLRGQGALPALLALEAQLDEIADALEEDPLELRRRHLATAEHAARVAAALGVPAPTAPVAAEEAMAAGADEIGWSRRWKTGSRSGPRRRGVGMALARHAVVGERGAASLRVREDGSFNLFVGASSTGTGAEAAFVAAAAETLGVPANQVVPAAGDTDSAPFDPGTAPPTLYLTGQAVQKAALLVRALLIAAGARWARRSRRGWPSRRTAGPSSAPCVTARSRPRSTRPRSGRCSSPWERLPLPSARGPWTRSPPPVPYSRS